MSSAAKIRTQLWFLASSFAAFLVLCAGSSVASGFGVVPDFALTDVNSTSSTFDQSVSPRDYLQQVSGWYFGHAT